jgi:hypothetical protein
MPMFDFVLTVRFWVFAWIVILFVGLMPVPPVAELVIVVGCIAHAAWFVQHRVDAIGARSTRRQAEDEDFRRRGARPVPGRDSSHPLVPAEPLEPTHHWGSVR